MRTTTGEVQLIDILLTLAFSFYDSEKVQQCMPDLDQQEQTSFLKIANSHHVVVRALESLLISAGLSNKMRFWATGSLENEQARIIHALGHLKTICQTLEAHDCPVVVIKSLDHSPDLGNDLDLFTTAPDGKVLSVFQRELGATPQPRSWGDRLANKWNFEVPGLPELVEVHCERIGQTGEQVAVARRFIARRISKTVGTCAFMTPAPEEQIIVATLQRMYRHFYFRICDIVNIAALVRSDAVDFAELKRACMLGGIWQGVATYLRIVCEYVEQYQGCRLNLPDDVHAVARFGKEKLTVQNGFIRMPIMPDCAKLYTNELASAARRGDIPAALRLSLLPPLASAAAVAYKVTGSDKGVW